MQPASLSARVALVGALVATALLAPLATAPVSAANPAEQLASVRAQVDKLGNEYFSARQRLHSLDTQLAELQKARERTERSYAAEHRLAVRRAVARYTAGSIFQSDANNALEAASTNVLLEHASETTNAAMQRYMRTRSSLIDTQHRIAQQRQAQQNLVRQLATRTDTLDRELASAQRAYRETLATRAAALGAATAAKANASDSSHPSTAVVATPPVPPVSNAPVSTPAPPAPPGTNPHHNDPFLSCVRRRESNGFYGAVNPGGYYGAYQFAITTWNITASHAGRPSLIGVRPDHASAWDQDDLAWTLYQWQGPGPWGGCP